MATRSAVKAEAQAVTPTYEFKGKAYSLPEDLDEVGLMEAYEEGKIITAAKTLVGAEMWVEFRKTYKKMDDLNALIEAAFGALGSSQGES